MRALFSRKFLFGLAAIGCCVWRPEAGSYVAAIALGFYTTHGIADSRWAKS